MKMLDGSSDEPFVANDNEPLIKQVRGDAVGFRSLLKQNQYNYKRSMLSARKSSQNHFDREPFSWFEFIYLSIWLVLAGLFFWSYYSGESIERRLITSSALIFAGLGSGYILRGHGYERLSELGILTSIFGSMALLVTGISQLGLPVPVDMAIFFIVIASLIAAYFNNSLMALTVSISVSCVWAALNLDGYLEFSAAMLMMPAVWCLQIMLAIRFRSHFMLLVSTLMGYTWIFGASINAYNAGSMSAAFLLAGVSVIGAMHLQVALFISEKTNKARNFQILLSWLLFTLSLTCLVHWGLYPEAAYWQDPATTQPITRIVWLCMVVFALTIIFACSLLRRKYADLSFIISCGLVTLIACMPAIVWFQNDIDDYLKAHASFQLFPVIGFILGGFIFGLALIFSIDGLRSRQFAFIAAGMIVVALVSELCFNGVYSDPTYLAGFAVGLVIVIGIHVMFRPFVQSEQQVQRYVPASNY